MIHWPELQPPLADLEALHERLRDALPLHSLCRLLVEITLRAYPWPGRADLVPCYHPSQTYKQGQRMALFISDAQNARRSVWLFAQVKDVRVVENPAQGRFQALTIESRGKQVQMAGGITGASYPEPDLSTYPPEDFAWLVEWILETYATSLQATVGRLIQNGQIHGRLAGATFLPEHLSALSPELLLPCFASLSPARHWLSLGEIHRSLPDLSPLGRDTVLGLLQASLRESPYRSLGGGRWTTPELFRQLDRQVPCGLPTPQHPEKGSVWMKQDERDMAGYDSQFLPREARRMLEELGMGEQPSEPDRSPWRPPTDPLQLPALNYLHITQAYFPVHSILQAFAPDVQLLFVQFIHGDHEPFLLDRENGLLKAIDPEKLQSRIREEDLPAGTYLWLEYQGNEKYRIAPRLLPFKRRVPCKLAYVENGQFHIVHTYISMMYAGDPALFKAHLRFEEIEALFAEASHLNRSVREAIIYAIREICASDPDHRAHWRDILNAVFLTRLCSPMSIALLLHSHPCFESPGGGYFRYKPMQDTTKDTQKRTTRLSQLWDDLLSDPVTPHPFPEERVTARSHLDVSYAATSHFAPDLELPFLLRLPQTEPETSLATLAYAPVEEEPVEAILLSHDEPGPYTPRDEIETERATWGDSLANLFHGLVAVEDPEPASRLEEQTIAENEALSDMTIAAAHEETLSFSSPFRWEPKPAWVNPPSQSTPPVATLTDPRHFVARPKIPIRPLHKQPFYRRFFFYLHRWLSKGSRKTG